MKTESHVFYAGCSVGVDAEQRFATALDPAAFDAQLDKLMPVLESMERIELVQRSTSDRVTLALRFVEKRK